MPAVDNPHYWRARAEEVRTLAETMTERELRETMFRIADGYDRMAWRVEARVCTFAKAPVDGREAE